MMRLYIPAKDIRPGDHLAGLGKVATVTIRDDDLIIVMDWLDAREHRLATDAEVWIDRPDWAIGGAA